MKRMLTTTVAVAFASFLVGVAVTGSGSMAAAFDNTATHSSAIAALEQDESSFHESISGGGNIDELMSLWADDATFTAGGVTQYGKAAIRAFFLQSGGFTHNWVSVSPEYKTRIQVHGRTAEIYFECHFVDWQANPQVVLTHGTFQGTAKKMHGHWLFWHITAGTNPLTP